MFANLGGVPILLAAENAINWFSDVARKWKRQRPRTGRSSSAGSAAARSCSAQNTQAAEAISRGQITGDRGQLICDNNYFHVVCGRGFFFGLYARTNAFVRRFLPCLFFGV